MADVNANIGINFDTSQALAQLRQLQAGLSRFNQTLTQGNVAAMNAQKGLNAQLMQAINATGKFVATQKDVATSTSSFTSALEKNQLSMKQYFRYTAAAATMNTKVFKNMFAQERETLTRASKDRVKLLQSQYIQMQAANGNMIKVLQVIPKHLKMVNGQYADYATRMQMAAQRQQFMNQLLKQGSTQLLNFGKNTQWAGRQLMVGLTIPLSILGSTAAKTFMEMEKAVTKFSRVYGDMMTNSDATDKAIADIQRLGKEFTKYGIAVKDTIDMAASAAAMGLTGDALSAQVVQATRLAVLGQVEQQQALETTISLTNAFGIASEDLAKKINYLNAVENQTVLSIEDLTIAIPKAGPVVKQLGGSVEDLAFFMTAMKEGGINASEGANALKSGLASMINPSKKASEFLAELGINITGIVNANAGDLKGTVVGFARALDTLDPLNRARAIEQMFGKFQFARLSTLFQNITKDGTQASRALGLAGASVEELAILSERELGKVEDMTGNKFKKSMENLKLQLVPIGKAFLQAVTPIVNFVGRVLERFNTLSDGTKKVITVIIGVIGGLAPVALMTFGVLMNAVANGIKLFAKLRGGIAQLNGSNNVLGGGFEYLTNEQIENVAQANALHTSHSQLISTFNVETASVQALAAAYGTAASQARALAQSSPGLFNTVPGPAGAVAGLPPTKFATGGVVPGTGNKDTVPALLTPGEVVITKDTAKANPELVAALQNGSVKRYHKGTGDGHAHPHQVPVPASISTFSEELGSRAKNPKDIAVVTERIQQELMKAYERGMAKGGPEMADTLVETIKGALQAAADRIGSTNKGFAKDTTKEINPDTGLPWREPYGKTSATEWQGADYVAAHLAAPKPKITDPAELERLSGLAGDSDLGRALALAAEHGGSATPMGSLTAMLPEQANKTTDLDLSNPEDAAIHAQLAARRVASGHIETPEEFSGKEAKVFEMPRSGIQELFTGADAGKSLAPVMREIARQHGLSFEEAVKDPAILAEMTAATDKLGGFISEELALLPDKIGEQDLYDAVERASGRLTEADGKLKTAVDNLGKTTTYSVTTNEPTPTPADPDKRSRVANRKDVPQKARELREELGTADLDVTTTTPDGKTKVLPFGSYQKKNKSNLDTGEIIDQRRDIDRQLDEFYDGDEDFWEGAKTPIPTIKVTEEDKAKAAEEGAKVGAAAADGVRGPNGTDADSPSKKGIKAGKEVADGIIQGMKEGEAEVASQSSRLGDAAVPTAAETQAKVDKMDLDNKSFYDDIDTPEFRDERQILKSQDRHRRKMGATGTVGGGPVTPPAPGPSSLTVASTARTEAASEQLAVSTEQAATAQSQVVQQIHDESKSRVTIKGNTVNIQKAREEADKAENEAAITRARAAALENEQAKQKRTGSPTTITDEQVLAAKEKANAAELEYARIRQELAEQGITAAQPGEMQEIATQDPVKTPAKVKKAEEVMSNGTVEAGDGLRRIVEGTDETAGSTLLVAEQTDELATVTGEAVDAQTETAGNLLTGAQITNATTGNMNDVLQSTDMTGTAQGDIADSSENIADINRDIEEDKRKIRALGQQELAARMKDAGAVIPDGAQSDTKRFDRTDAPSYTEAYDEVMGRDPGTNGPDDPGQTGYTRNKKGQFIFDPETGEPTTLTQKQVTKKKRGMRKEKVAKYSGKATGALGTATMIAGAAGAPPQVTAALGTAATVAQFAPMIAGTGPIGLAVGAVVALGAGAYMLNKHFNQMAAKAAQFAKDLSATRDGLKAIGQVSGKVGASEIMDKRRETSQYGKYDESIKIDNTFGSKFLGTDAGKKEKKLFQDNVKKFGNDKAINDLSLKLAGAVADGVLDAEAANSIAAELALQVKDQKVEMQIIGQLGALLGPDGENLKNKPLETRLLLMDNANQRVTKTEEDIASGIGNTRENVASVAAYNMNNIEMATMMADQVQLEYETQKKKLEAELASTTNAQKKLDIGKQIAALDAKNLENSLLMNAQLLRQIDLQTKSFNKVYSDSRWGSQAGKEDAYFDGTRSQLETTYKGTDQEEASKTFLNTTESFNSDDFSMGADQKTIQTFQAKIEMLVGSKVLSPAEANNYLELFSGKLDEFDILFNTSVQFHGPAKTKELLNMFAGYENKVKATQMISQIALTKQNPAEFDAIMETLKGIQALDGTTIDMELLLTTVGLEGVEQLKSQMEGIEKLKDAQEKNGDKKMDLERVRKLGAIESSTVDALIANTKRKQEFDSLTLDQQAEYLQKLQTQFAYEGLVNDTQRALDAESFARQQTLIAQANGKVGTSNEALLASIATFKAAYLALTGAERALIKVEPVTATGIVTKDPGPAKTPSGKGKKDDPYDFLKDLAMRIKMTRDAAFDATKPLESMLKAFAGAKSRKDVSSMFEMFKGVQQTLIGLKVPKELRDYIAGLDPKQFKELEEAGAFTYATKKDKKTGKDLKDAKGNVIYDKSKIVGLSESSKGIIQAYREAPLDNFNLAQREIITNTDNQFKAFNKLKGAGVDTATALEMLQDEALAASIASNAIEGKDLKTFTDDIKAATAATQKYAVISDLLKKNEEFKFKSESVPKLAAALKETGMSVENIQTVLSDPALAKELIEDLKDGKIDSKAIADYLNNIKDEKIVEIRGKFNAGDFAGAAAPGMDLVNKMFSVQEQLIRTGVDSRSTAMVRRLKDLKESNEDLQLAIQTITFDFIRPIEEAMEKASRDVEINITRKIEEYQEQVNDFQRVIELAFERPIADINAENTILSEDMNIMNHAAEEINKRYDEQAKALEKVSEIKSQLVEQEKEQLDLADALSKGDIGAAARAIQAIRAAQAARNAENASKALELSRKNKIDNLRGDVSGLSKDEITERQYQNAKTIYALENTATTEVTRADGSKASLTKLEILKEIQDINDNIYAKEEAREAAQLKIRGMEDEIYKINQEQIKPKQKQIDAQSIQIAKDEDALQNLVENITVLGKTKDVWDGITAKIEASSLAGSDFDRLMGGMLASVDKIDEGWKSIESTMAKYSSATAMGPDTAMAKQRTEMLTEYNKNAGKSKELIDGAKETLRLAQEEYETKKKQHDLEIESLKTKIAAAKADKDWWIVKNGEELLAKKLKEAPVAPVSGPSRAADNANVNYNDPTKNAAQDLYDQANKEAKGSKQLYTYKGPGGASLPGPGGSTTKPPTGTTTKPPGGTTTKPPATTTKPPTAPVSPFAGLTVAKPGQTIANRIGKVSGGNFNPAYDARGDFDRMKDKIKATYKDGGGLNPSHLDDRSDVVNDTQKFLGRIKTDADKIKAKKDLDELLRLYDRYQMFNFKTGSDGKKTETADTMSSDGYKAVIQETIDRLPKDLRKALQTLKDINSSFEQDKILMTTIRKQYRDERARHGYDDKPIDDKFWGIDEIRTTNPEAYAKIKPLYDKYMAQKKIMDEKARFAANGRGIIKGAGWNVDDLGFYFGKGLNLAKNDGAGNWYNKSTDYTKWKGYATGGLVSSRFAQKKFSMGTDTVPAMLTPGEFVMNKFAVQSNGIEKMKAINNGQAVGDAVYNYSISVNVKSESNPDEIARTVIAQIKSVDAQKMRGVRT